MLKRWQQFAKFGFILSLPQLLGAACCNCGQIPLPPPGYSLLADPNNVIGIGTIVDPNTLTPRPGGFSCLDNSTGNIKTGSSVDESSTFNMSSSANIVANFKQLVGLQASAASSQSVTITAKGVNEDSLKSNRLNLNGACTIPPSQLATATYVQSAHRASSYSYAINGQFSGSVAGASQGVTVQPCTNSSSTNQPQPSGAQPSNQSVQGQACSLENNIFNVSGDNLYYEVSLATGIPVGQTLPVDLDPTSHQKVFQVDTLTGWNFRITDNMNGTYKIEGWNAVSDVNGTNPAVRNPVADGTQVYFPVGTNYLFLTPHRTAANEVSVQEVITSSSPAS